MVYLKPNQKYTGFYISDETIYSDSSSHSDFKNFPKNVEWFFLEGTYIWMGNIVRGGSWIFQNYIGRDTLFERSSKPLYNDVWKKSFLWNVSKIILLVFIKFLSNNIQDFTLVIMLTRHMLIIWWNLDIHSENQSFRLTLLESIEINRYTYRQILLKDFNASNY